MGTRSDQGPSSDAPRRRSGWRAMIRRRGPRRHPDSNRNGHITDNGPSGRAPSGPTSHSQ